MLSSPTWSTINTAVSKNNNNNNRFNRNDNAVTDYHLKQQQHIHEFSVTGTPKPATTNLNDIFITVKTTKLYHDTRLALIIKTWFQLAKDQVSWKMFIHFFSLLLKQCTYFVTCVRISQRTSLFQPTDPLQLQSPCFFFWFIYLSNLQLLQSNVLGASIRFLLFFTY